MCIPKQPKPVPNIVAQAAPTPEAPPKPVEISSQASAKRRAGRKNLRIDLAAPSGTASGVRV